MQTSTVFHLDYGTCFINIIKTKMKSRFFFFTIVLLICTNATSQLKVKIISAADGTNLSYATIANLTLHKTYSANEYGEIEIGLLAKTGDSLRITHVGYLPKDCVNSNNISKTIVLNPDNSILSPVIISHCKKYKSITVKNNPKKKHSGNDLISHFAGYGWLFGEKNYQVGMLLKNTEQGIRLKNFSFWLKKMTAPDSAVLAPWLINVYNVNDSSGLPSKPLFRDPIVYFPKEEGKQTISFDTMQIAIPENGVYITFQYIMDEKYAWMSNMIPHSMYSDTTIVSYGAVIDGISTPGYTISRYMGKEDKWIKRPENESIRFEAVLSYCRDKEL
jgi:hypothetical protein